MHATEEPRVDIEMLGARITLLGTAHVSKASADQVRKLIEGRQFDAVAVELCPSRYASVIDPKALARMDLFSVIRERRVYRVVASLALSAYQQRLAEQFEIEAGAEQRMAIELANSLGLPVLLVDREIGVTLRRVSGNLSWWKRFSLFAGLVSAMLTSEDVTEDDIERLKEGDVLETTFAEFAEDRQDLYEPLIAERDRYMAARLRQEIEQHGHKRVLAVLGAGHLRGVAEHLENDRGDAAKDIAVLEQIPVRSRWPKTLPWIIVALILSGFAYGFSRSSELGFNLIGEWVLINGGLSALGVLLAAGHPLTLLSAFVAAPLTSLNPTVGAGMVTGAVELAMRKPSVGDFGHLRSDITNLRGWWRNRVSRVLLVFLFSTLGSAIGTYVAGYRIFDQLF